MKKAIHEVLDGHVFAEVDNEMRKLALQVPDVEDIEMPRP